MAQGRFSLPSSRNQHFAVLTQFFSLEQTHLSKSHPDSLNLNLKLYEKIERYFLMLKKAINQKKSFKYSKECYNNVRYFPKGFLKRQLPLSVLAVALGPQPVLAVALGPLVHPSRSSRPPLQPASPQRA